MSTNNTPPKPKIHTSDLPRSLSPSPGTQSKPLPPSMNQVLTAALLQSQHNPSQSSIPVIERTLTEELAKAGWTSALRSHVQNLVRSGECSSYSEIMKRVLLDIRLPEGKEDKKDVSEEAKKSLAVPQSVVDEGIKVIRKELEKVAVVVVDD
ncbi:hypothetical protein BLS_006525 [Venturia inaequalis]|uniref:Uncharacterized protein n=1 Tax=Venturia inaequalis TaxID=5025 RepID=A0A8H3UB13_VENIN|nr:hypothetical protein BLS_006525 [Venturia inaequalis]KAE9973895.1 hypothetical protein EG328_004181 [Venturia inaequalis]KAE9991401.1 hypothetical protein EG327_011704 [Venturia inaequalis]